MRRKQRRLSAKQSALVSTLMTQAAAKMEVAAMALKMRATMTMMTAVTLRKALSQNPLRRVKLRAAPRKKKNLNQRMSRKRKTTMITTRTARAPTVVTDRMDPLAATTAAQATDHLTLMAMSASTLETCSKRNPSATVSPT